MEVQYTIFIIDTQNIFFVEIRSSNFMKKQTTNFMERQSTIFMEIQYTRELIHIRKTSKHNNKDLSRLR